MARGLTHLLIAAIVPSAMACVLLVEDRSGSLTCAFAGRDDATCGLCIAAHCQGSVDACCGDASCRDILPSLDRCGRGEGCDDLLGATSAKGLPACVRMRCASECAATSGEADASSPQGRDSGTSKAICSGSTRECSCTATETEQVRALTCDSTSFGGATCCAEPGFPNAPAGCTCYENGCVGDGSDTGCLCGPGVEYDVSTCQGPCCVSEDQTQCRCRGGFCLRGESEVPSCKSVRYDCGPGKRRVDSCSL